MHLFFECTWQVNQEKIPNFRISWPKKGKIQNLSYQKKTHNCHLNFIIISNIISYWIVNYISSIYVRNTISMTVLQFVFSFLFLISSIPKEKSGKN